MSEVANIPQLRFPEFSGEWDKETIGGVSQIFGRIGYRGYTVQDIVDKGEGAISLSPSNFINNQIETTKSTYISWLKYEESPEIKILDGDILFVKTGSTYGKTAFVSNLKEKATINPQIVVLKNISINNKFLGYIVTTQTIRKQVEQIVVGGAIPTMSQKELSKMEFGLPTKPEQQKIAAFLTAVDNKIEQLSKKQELLGEYKKGLMQQIFSQAIRFKADDGSEFPDWEETKLGDVSDCLDNRRQPLNGAERNQMKGDIPYYGANGIVDYVNDYIFDEELVLLAEDGGNFNDFSSKPIAQKISGKAWVNNHAHILRAKSIITTDFLFYSLVHKDIRRYIVGGSRVKLNKSDLLSIKTILPPLEEQTKIASFLSSIDSKIEQVGKQLDESKQFKKALLQQMFV